MNKDKVGRIEFGPEKTMRAPVLDDEIEHPSHYTQGKIEVIDFLIDQDMNFMAANAVKYLCRYRFKGNPVQDLKKAKWYLNRLIKEVEMAQPDPRCKTFGVLADDLRGVVVTEDDCECMDYTIPVGTRFVDQPELDGRN